MSEGTLNPKVAPRGENSPTSASLSDIGLSRSATAGSTPAPGHGPASGGPSGSGKGTPKKPNPPAPETAGETAATKVAGTVAAKVAMVVAYEGSAFHGWQIQERGPTVQGKLEEALRIATGGHIRVHGSGRTDSGVHALNQVAHFALPAGADLHKLRGSLNGLAGPHISVKALFPIGQDFHARHSAIGKIYRYHLFTRAYPPIFSRTRCWWLHGALDVDAMRAAAGHLIGSHDFSAFRSSHCTAKSPVRRMLRIDVETEDGAETGSAAGSEEQADVRISMEAGGFLQHMARIITGTLVAVGQGNIKPGEVKQILAGGRREDAGVTAPGRGLFLVRVFYDCQVFPELADFS